MYAVCLPECLPGPAEPSTLHAVSSQAGTIDDSLPVQQAMMMATYGDPSGRMLLPLDSDAVPGSNDNFRVRRSEAQPLVHVVSDWNYYISSVTRASTLCNTCTVVTRSHAVKLLVTC